MRFRSSANTGLSIERPVSAARACMAWPGEFLHLSPRCPLIAARCLRRCCPAVRLYSKFSAQNGTASREIRKSFYRSFEQGRKGCLPNCPGRAGIPAIEQRYSALRWNGAFIKAPFFPCRPSRRQGSSACKTGFDSPRSRTPIFAAIFGGSAAASPAVVESCESYTHQNSPKNKGIVENAVDNVDNFGAKPWIIGLRGRDCLQRVHKRPKTGARRLRHPHAAYSAIRSCKNLIFPSNPYRSAAVP